jgi:hypothetical protein
VEHRVAPTPRARTPIARRSIRSTRDVDDFEAAAQKACELATITPLTTDTPLPATRTPPASSAWDGRYVASPTASSGELCARPDYTGTLTVSGGRFSYPWYVDDWTQRAEKPIKVGRVDGVVHANGTTTTTVSFAEPVLRSTQVRTVKVKRQLDAIKQVPLTFSRRDKTKVAKVTGDCKLAWEIPLPKPAAPPARPAPPRSPSSSPPPSPPSPPPAANDERRARCRNSCDTKHEQCRENRCEAPKEACRTRCEDISDSSERAECTHRCAEPLMSCRIGCDDERDTCKADCATL